MAIVNNIETIIFGNTLEKTTPKKQINIVE